MTSMQTQTATPGWLFFTLYFPALQFEGFNKMQNHIGAVWEVSPENRSVFPPLMSEFQLAKGLFITGSFSRV